MTSETVIDTLPLADLTAQQLVDKVYFEPGLRTALELELAYQLQQALERLGEDT
jgi:hypothetical protein